MVLKPIPLSFRLRFVLLRYPRQKIHVYARHAGSSKEMVAEYQEIKIAAAMAVVQRLFLPWVVWVIFLVVRVTLSEIW